MNVMAAQASLPDWWLEELPLRAEPQAAPCEEWAVDKKDFTFYPRAEQRARLESFRSLSRGWDSYDAEPPSEAAIANALRILHVLWTFKDAPPPIDTISPSVEGGVGIVFFGPNKKYADIECFNDGDILAIISDEAAEPIVWTLEIGSLIDDVERISSFLNGR